MAHGLKVTRTTTADYPADIGTRMPARRLPLGKLTSWPRTERWAPQVTEVQASLHGGTVIERRTVQWQRPGPGATARGRLREIASGISQLRHPLWKPLQGQPRWPEWLPWRDGRTQSLPERALERTPRRVEITSNLECSKAESRRLLSGWVNELARSAQTLMSAQ